MKDKEEADVRVAELERALAKERVRTKELTRKIASEKAAYPDLCVAAVEQFKASLEFQMAVDATVARGLTREGEGGADSLGVAVAGRTKEEVIQSFQQLDCYKHEMSQY